MPHEKKRKKEKMSRSYSASMPRASNGYYVRMLHGFVWTWVRRVGRENSIHLAVRTVVGEKATKSSEAGKGEWGNGIRKAWVRRDKIWYSAFRSDLYRRVSKHKR